MEYEKYLEENQEAMIAGLQKLIRCESVEQEAVTEKDGQFYPFGRGVQDALETTLKMAEDMGFVTKNVDNYGGHIDFPGTGKPILNEKGEATGFEKPKIMAVIGHLDVVPAGGEWDFDPFGGEVKDGRIYGRGTTDDKGPVVSCLFAMKALKDAGYQPVNTIRLILGLDEETHWKGMEYYFSKEERPDYGFTPDSDFPVVNGEKGLLIFDFARKFSKSRLNGLRLCSVKGGTAPNSVPDHCRAVVKSEDPAAYQEIKKQAEDYSRQTGYHVSCKGSGKSLEITTAGVSAHGAKPEEGLNAISVMMEFLGRLNFTSEDQKDFIGFYNAHIGFSLNGSGLHADLKDEASGSLVFNVGMIDLDPEAARLTINIRYPVSAAEEEVFAPMEEILNRYDIGIVKKDHRPPIFLDLDNPMVETLLEIYRKQSGDWQTEPLVIGGGTYARCTPGIIAYGAQFPGDADLMHQKNEALEISRLVLMTKIYAEAIYKLSQGGYNI